jgi:hypothetical protein
MLPGRRRARLAAAALLVAASAGLARADDGNCPIIDFTCGATNKDANSSVSPSWCRAVNPWLIAQVRQRCRARGARVRAESTQRDGAARLVLWECMLRVCGRRTRSASRHLTCFLPSSFRPRAQPPTNLREIGDDGSMARGVYKSRYSCGGAGAGMLAVHCSRAAWTGAERGSPASARRKDRAASGQSSSAARATPRR